MHEFWTGAEAAFRKDAVEYFRRSADAGPAGAPAAPEAIWRDLCGSDGGGVGAASPGDCLSRRVSIFEAAARHDPRLGHDLLAWRSAAAPPAPAEETACRLGRAAGTAAHVLEAGASAAREKGYYSSSLMDFREVQERLAGLVAGAGLAHLGACRLCRLLEKGETDRAALEAGALDSRVAALEADVRSVAGSLLGPSWVKDRLPAAIGPTASERTRR
ncbi:MAG: hypothetical protein ACXW2H_05520 [Candidatus Aminicenantales bacterium]